MGGSFGLRTYLRIKCEPFKDNMTYKKDDVTEGVLQKHLRVWKPNYDLIAYNMFLFPWESDFAMKTISGFWHEVECKISLADFKHDFEKFEKHDYLLNGNYWKWRRVKRIKSEEEAEQYKDSPYHRIVTERKGVSVLYTRSGIDGNATRPNYFWYCVPWFIADKVRDLVPIYSGLLVMDEHGRITEEREAPLLHKEKYANERFHLTKKYFYHWLHLQQSVDTMEYEKKIKRLKHELSVVKAEFKAVCGYDFEESL